MSRSDSHVKIARYEPCPDCTDGTCKLCGETSSENAAPGVRLVIREVRFVRCSVCGGTGKHAEFGPVGSCGSCGFKHHELAAPGIATEVIEEHTTKRHVAVVHLRRSGSLDGDVSACGTPHASDEHLTNDRTAVTCTRCKKWR